MSYVVFRSIITGYGSDKRLLFTLVGKRSNF